MLKNVKLYTENGLRVGLEQTETHWSSCMEKQVKTNLGGWSWESDGSGFPVSSVGKESACNVGNLGLIPGSGRSTGEGIGYPLQYSWASLVAQLVQNPPAVWETWVQSLGWEDPLGKEKATHSSILAWRIPWTVHEVTKSRTWLSDFHFHWVSYLL